MFGPTANDVLTRMAEMLKATIRLVEIAELLGVSKQRAHQIADESGFPPPLSEDARGRIWDRRGRGVGQGLAAREALALIEKRTGRL
jgi:hypothetical protein